MPTFLGGQNPQDGEGESNIGIGELAFGKTPGICCCYRGIVWILHMVSCLLVTSEDSHFQQITKKQFDAGGVEIIRSLAA